MDQALPSAIVVCREAFVRETVIETLAIGGLSVLKACRFIEDDLVELDTPPDLILYIDSGHSLRNCARDAENIGRLVPTNWIVMCDSADNPVLEGLRALNRPVSAAPLDVSREDLAFLARLVARGRRVLIDDFCQASRIDEARALRRLNLDTEQWGLLRCLAEGLSNKAIANRQQTTEATVKVQIRTLLGKLGVKNRTQAAVFAAHAGLGNEAAMSVGDDRDASCAANSQKLVLVQ